MKFVCSKHLKNTYFIFSSSKNVHLYTPIMCPNKNFHLDTVNRLNILSKTRTESVLEKIDSVDIQERNSQVVFKHMSLYQITIKSTICDFFYYNGRILNEEEFITALMCSSSQCQL